MSNFWGRRRSTSPTPTEATAVCSPSEISLSSTVPVKYEKDIIIHDQFKEGDVEIVCGKTHFRVNSVVLSLSSKEFARLKDSPQQVVLDVPAADMEVFLQLVYAGKPGFGPGGSAPTDSLGPAAVLAQDALLKKYGANLFIKTNFRDSIRKRGTTMVAALGDRPSRDAVLQLLEMARLLDLDEVWVEAFRNTPNSHGWTAMHDPYTLTKAEAAAYPHVAKFLIETAQRCGSHGLKAIASIKFWDQGSSVKHSLRLIYE